MVEKNEKPEIRFTEFTDPWEQRELGDMMNVTSVKRIHQSDWTNSGIRFLRARDIVSAARNEEPTDYLYISEEKYNEYSAISGKVKQGDLLVTGVGTIGVPMLITSDNPVYFKDGNIIWFKNENKIVGNFLYYSFISNGIQDFIKNSAGIGTVGTYTIESGKKTPIMLPEIKEQELIGRFLLNLDKLITLYQRKYDKLIIVKKSMFVKMFPKDGATVPEIRFAGFTDAWERRKLGDISERVKGNDGRMDLPTLTISAVSGWLDQRDRFYGNIAGKEQENYTLLSKGELSYNHGNSKLAKYGTVFELRNYEEALVPRVYHSFRVNKDAVPNFIEYLFATKLPDKELGKLISSGARMDGLLNISFDDFMGITLSIPERAEQDKIGNYFRCLDNLINLHQRELEKLRNIKKSLLEKMFV